MEKATQQAVDFYTVLQERRSVRHYDSSVKISRDELEELLDEAIKAPSSSNLQPWRFLVIDDQSLKEKLLPIAFNQQQVVDAAAIVAVLGDMEGYKQAESIYQDAVDAGFMTVEAKETLVGNINRRYADRDPQVTKEILLVDAGLVSMQLMLAAKARGYDTVPMGGYNTEQFKQAFSIPDRYVSVMLIAIGKAAQPGHKTTRLPVDQITSWNKLDQ